MTTWDFRIRGMDCAEEVDALRKAMRHVPGVSELEFDLLNGTMSVEADPGSVSVEQVQEAVRKAGLEAEVFDPTRPSADEDTGGGFWDRRGRLTLCLVSGVFLVVGFLSHAWSRGSILQALVVGEGDAAHPLPILSILADLAAVFCGAWYVIPKALAAIRSFRADMNLLMTIAVAGALAIGQWFEAGAVSFLFALALVLESWSVGRARHAIRALLDIAPRQARYYGPHDRDIITGAIENVPVGVEVIVRPGERVPLDGVVCKGSTTVNESPITGESVAVEKGVGDSVLAGTINNEGVFEFRTTKLARDTTLARIIRMVEEVQSRRAPTEQWVERFARYYTPAMLGIALVTALLPPLAFGGGWGHWFYQALVMLVIACPCALVISTPVSIVAGLTAAARAGVLIKGGAYLEAPARLRAIALDKTGTLTRGRPEVQQVVPYSGHTSREVMERAAALEAYSEHPLARAVLRRAEAEGISATPAESYQAVRGKGAEAVIGGRRFWIGSHRMMDEKGAETEEMHRTAESLEDAGHSVIVVGNDAHVCGFLSISDGVRPQAAGTVQRLRQQGIRKIVMLTGDNEGTARAVGAAVGVDDIRFGLLPEDKLRAVESLVREFGQVAMVGDGVNDAPAMARATVSVAMGAAGTDAAIETSDIALMSDDLAKLPWLIAHSRRTLRVMMQNIVFALGVKALFMALAVAGAATLWMAIAADMGASLLVIFNGLRLLRGRGSAGPVSDRAEGGTAPGVGARPTAGD